MKIILKNSKVPRNCIHQRLYGNIFVRATDQNQSCPARVIDANSPGRLLQNIDWNSLVALEVFVQYVVHQSVIVAAQLFNLELIDDKTFEAARNQLLTIAFLATVAISKRDGSVKSAFWHFSPQSPDQVISFIDIRSTTPRNSLPTPPKGICKQTIMAG